MSRNVTTLLRQPRAVHPYARTLHSTSPRPTKDLTINGTQFTGGTEEHKHSKAHLAVLLQHKDQQHLNTALYDVDRLKAYVEETVTYVSTSTKPPTSIKIIPEIPTYTLAPRPRGAEYGNLDDFFSQSENAVKAAENVRLHIIDLKHLPYESDKVNEERIAFSKEVEAMSDEHKRSLLQDLKRQEAAEKSRMSSRQATLKKNLEAEGRRWGTQPRGPRLTMVGLGSEVAEDVEGALDADVEEEEPPRGNWGAKREKEGKVKAEATPVLDMRTKQNLLTQLYMGKK